MSDATTAVPQKKPRHSPKLAFRLPSKPLDNAKRELFAQRVASGMKVRDAYEASGYGGKAWSMWDLRNQPEIKERIEWLLERRVQARLVRRSRAEKAFESDEMMVMQRLRDIARADIRDVVQWEPKAQVDDQGNVVGIVDELTLTPSRKLSRSQAAAIKAVFVKAGQIRVELHDPQKAAVDLAKMLGLGKDDSPPPAPNVSIGTLNLNADAAEVARRLAFVLNTAFAGQPKTLELTAQEGKPQGDAPKG